MDDEGFENLRDKFQPRDRNKRSEIQVNFPCHGKKTKFIKK